MCAAFAKPFARSFPGPMDEQKRRELRIGQAFQAAYGLCPPGELLPGEAPDLRLITEEVSYGIEITELFHLPDSTGIVRQAEETSRNYVTQQTREALRVLKVPPATIRISYRSYYGLSYGDRNDALNAHSNKHEDIAHALARLIADNLPPSGKAIGFHIGSHWLRPHVDRIYIDRSYDEKQIMCTHTGGGIVPAIRSSMLEERLAQKSERFHTDSFNSSFDVNWLVVATGLDRFSKYFEFRHDETKAALRQEYAYPFDAAFVFDGVDGEVYPLKRAHQS